MEELYRKDIEAASFNKKEYDNASTTGISPLAENLILNSPCNNISENHFGLEGKLVRCTSTPSYSSLSRFAADKNALFTSNIQLDDLQVTEVGKKKEVVNRENTIHDSLYGSSCDNTVNDSDVPLNSISSRGKFSGSYLHGGTVNF